MSGKKTHWQVGTDHAGIATQMVVENNLSKKNIDRKDLGREKFLQEVWKWKDFSEDKIQSQIKRLGSTVDWNKYRFTLDDKFSKAVNKAFVDLYRNKKIYRGYRLVNWDPSLKTAVSDLEVVRQEKKGTIWYTILEGNRGRNRTNPKRACKGLFNFSVDLGEDNISKFF